MAYSRAKFWTAFLALVGAVALGSSYLFPDAAPDDIAAPAQERRPAALAAAAGAGGGTEPSLSLPRRAPTAAEGEGGARDIFQTKSWYVPPPPPPPQPVVAPPPPPPPQAPPLPFQFMGWMDDGDQLRAFLSRGEKVYTVGEGEQVDASYQVQRVEPSRITFLYVPLSQTQTLALAGGPATPAAPISPTAHAAPEPLAAPLGAAAQGSGIGSAAAAEAAGVAGKLSPEDLDPAAVAMRIRQQQMRDRARSRVIRR